ncbi:MAG: DUF547 domain-containing protein [Planctomycetota bacterium]|nr:MAG: DUF547 domain-containing protein [Planctomycetota bacterium]
MTFIKRFAKHKKPLAGVLRLLQFFSFCFIFLFIASLTAVFFIAGCRQEVTPEPVEPPKVQAPKLEPPKVQARPTVSFHDKCADILTNYVDEEGMVDYKTLKRKRFDLKKLLDEFDNLDRELYNSWPQEDKIAFWLNAYNIQMLKIIVDNYPIESSRIYRLFWPPTSIRHIKDIWNKYKFVVMDEEFTLAEIEKRLFRQEFDEPRIFFALSQASISSPPLRNEPYYGHRLYEQLDHQVKKFLADTQGFRIDRYDKTVYLSAILQPTWFGREFFSKYGTDKKFKDQQPPTRAVLNFITNYISEHDIAFLEVQNYSIKYMKYDWRLNDGS